MTYGAPPLPVHAVKRVSFVEEFRASPYAPTWVYAHRDHQIQNWHENESGFFFQPRRVVGCSSTWFTSVFPYTDGWHRHTDYGETFVEAVDRRRGCHRQRRRHVCHE